MSAYIQVPLGEICQFLGGGTPSRKVQEYWNGNIPWASVKDFGLDLISSTKEFISKKGLNNSSSKVVPTGTVLLVTRVGLGKVAIAGVDLAINQDIKAIIPSNSILPEFLFWSLKYLGPQITSKGTGATVKGVTLQDVRNLQISLPPLDEQRRIVGILNRAAKIERLRTQAQERLREFIPALFIKMFGDPATNPMGWERATLGELSQVQGGLQVTRKRKVHPLETPYLRVANVLRNRLDLREVKSMRVNEKELTRIQLMRGDLLIVEGHGNPSEIGRVAIWDGSIDGCVHQNHLIRVRPNPETLSPQFTCAFLNSSSGRQHLLRSGKTTSGLNTISVSDVKSCTLFTPPIDLQRQFTEFVNFASDLTSLANSGQRLATASSSSLMDRLLKDIS